MTQTELRALLAFLAATPEVVRQLAGALAAAGVRYKPAPTEFSALEQVCHLRDIEREGYAVRLRRLLAEDEPALPDIDGGKLARERDYQRQDFASALAAFTDARQENVALVETLAPEQLARAGLFEGVGRVTLTGVLAMMREHDEAHRVELLALSKRLGTGELND